MKAILGIDPGKAGAFALLFGELAIFAPMPTNEQGEISYDIVKRFLGSVAGMAGGLIPHVTLERAIPMAMGSKHAFNYGRGFAALEIAITENKLPVTYVEPNKWTKEICEGIDTNLKPKARSLIAVKRLFPQFIESMPKGVKSGKLHDGVVDALLIAEYGRRHC